MNAIDLLVITAFFLQNSTASLSQFLDALSLTVDKQLNDVRTLDATGTDEKPMQNGDV